MHDPRYPPVSRPAGDFGPSVEMPETTAAKVATGIAGCASLDVVCRRPIHHVLEYSALHRELERLRDAAPDAVVRLFMATALEDPVPFAELPAERIERFDVDAPFEPPPPLVAGHREILELDAQRLDFAGAGRPSNGRAAVAGDRFFAAVSDASPRWRRAADAGETVRLPEAPSVLIHQARFHLGDTLWLTPLLRGLRSLAPEARVTVLGPSVARRALAGHPDVDAVWVHSPASGESARQALGERLRRHPFDAALFALVRHPASFWVAEAVAGAGTPLRVNLEYFDRPSDGRGSPDPFTHEGFFFWGTMASPRLLLHALDPFSPPASASSGAPLRDRRLSFDVFPDDVVAARRRLAELRIGEAPFAVMTPGGKSSERWPAERFAALARRLAEARGWHVLLDGAPEERGTLEEIAAAAGNSRVHVVGGSLGEMAALLRRARLLVSNDSAPIHLAETTATPTLYFAQHEKLTHSHPAGPRCWALYDETANRIAAITVDQAWGALEAMGEGDG